MGKLTHLGIRENLSRHLIEQLRQEPAPTRRSIATGHGDAQAAPAGASGHSQTPTSSTSRLMGVHAAASLGG